MIPNSQNTGPNMISFAPGELVLGEMCKILALKCSATPIPVCVCCFALNVLRLPSNPHCSPLKTSCRTGLILRLSYFWRRATWAVTIEPVVTGQRLECHRIADGNLLSIGDVLTRFCD